MRRFQFAVLFCLAAVVALSTTGCQESKAPVKACCEQPQIPPNVPQFKVVADDIAGPGDGQSVKIKTVLQKPGERQEVYKVLHTLYAWSLTRAPFEPIDFRAEVYDSEAAATAGKQPLAYIERPKGKLGPECENSIPWTFQQSVERAFESSLNRAPVENTLDTCRLEKAKPVARVDKDFSHQPKLSMDAAARSAEVEYPFLAKGKDEDDPTLSFNKAMTYWIEFTTSMFRRAPDLKLFKFVGTHKGAPVATISVDRNTFETSLASLQEEIASHSAVTFQKLGMNATSDKAAEKEQDDFRSKTFHQGLKLLPAGQVSLSKNLK